ncbi:hypothetical protein [Streptomyces sp. NPDC059072]|uniref:hypothetical protein n=1 Tax=Streptomyces sp. NPDC059072 TaxID=3346715 RepID=UPI003699A0E1
MARRRRLPGGAVVALAVGVPMAAVGVVLAVVFSSTGHSLRDDEMHHTVDRYLDAVGGSDGQVPASGPDSACPAAQADPTRTLRGFAPVFGHRIVSSVRTGDSASVNVDLRPRAGEGAPVAVALELRRTGDRWDVCSASEGRVDIDPS